MYSVSLGPHDGARYGGFALANVASAAAHSGAVPRCPVIFHVRERYASLPPVIVMLAPSPPSAIRYRSSDLTAVPEVPAPFVGAVHPPGHVIAELPSTATTARSKSPEAMPLGSVQTCDVASAGVTEAAVAAMMGWAICQRFTAALTGRAISALNSLGCEQVAQPAPHPAHPARSTS